MDIHNICIYQKQDVYAKFSLTSDPETALSTKIINGGGQNPIFNETISLDVHSVDASLKCEVWMLSRIKNYLEDQLLGFALVPLSEVLLSKKNQLINKEFSLSSTNLFHIPAGSVQLSISYIGSSPDVLEVHTPTEVENEDLLIPCEYEKIEFPDLKIVDETNLLVSECTSIPCSGNINMSFKSGETSPKENDNLTKIEKPFLLPVMSINSESEQTVVQQDIVDMYMKSMEQFTVSLAKMKLPIDVVTTEGVDVENSATDSKQKSKLSTKSTGSRPFYGSRAFF
ncbi:hypothetical protein QJS04_geneDACA022181 [Acorus gramineus]|uniref:C2 domain-containing protein n=1 Tax=Acorus gramineus TaxID=55184 RepID=A0AAV9BC20_ACOGR|nr:hypothetical protein QJS04_geneDACA022181 [Acorus gramineus]